ncbi:MAG: nucleotidyltransferase domain-containing protein [Nanoarchaeota archaeon]
MTLINAIKKPEMRRIFGERELKIIEKQLKGVNLLPSERTRLSRDIRKKLEAVRLLSPFIEDFKLKKGLYLKEIIENARNEIFKHPLSRNIKRIILFGTAVENKLRLGSDIDLAIEFDKEINEKEAFKFKLYALGKVNDKIDIQIFNKLPEEIKSEIDKRGKILFEKKG